MPWPFSIWGFGVLTLEGNQDNKGHLSPQSQPCVPPASPPSPPGDHDGGGGPPAVDGDGRGPDPRPGRREGRRGRHPPRPPPGEGSLPPVRPGPDPGGGSTQLAGLCSNDLIVSVWGFPLSVGSHGLVVLASHALILCLRVPVHGGRVRSCVNVCTLPPLDRDAAHSSCAFQVLGEAAGAAEGRPRCPW